jgi:putative redox protein
MDASPQVGGSDTASRPLELLLVALGGCTGMDVVSLLRKMGVDFEGFEIELKGKQAEDHPKALTKIHLTYRIKGDVPQDKLKKAIELSQKRYCSVAHSLRAEISYECRIEK